MCWSNSSKSVGHVGQARIALGSALKNMPVKAFPMPTVEGLAAEVRRHVHLAANQLAAFNREVDLTAALIAGHADGPALNASIKSFDTIYAVLAVPVEPHFGGSLA